MLENVTLLYLSLKILITGTIWLCCWLGLTLYGHIKPQSNGPLYRKTVIGTLAIDEWAVVFSTARRGLGGLRPCPVPSSLYQM